MVSNKAMPVKNLKPFFDPENIVVVGAPRTPGFGYTVPPVKRVHQILAHVRGQIRRRTRLRGHPPGFVYLKRLEISLLLRKRKAELPDHWIRDFVEIGPPVRVYGVLVVADRRRE